MPFGPYRGEAMANVPPDYLLHLEYEGCKHEGVNQYIADNMEVLLKEVNAQLTHEDPSDRYRNIQQRRY
jgi:uncharacterized protein (DUF3820 family)